MFCLIMDSSKGRTLARPAQHDAQPRNRTMCFPVREEQLHRTAENSSHRTRRGGLSIVAFASRAFTQPGRQVRQRSGNMKASEFDWKTERIACHQAASIPHTLTLSGYCPTHQAL